MGTTTAATTTTTTTAITTIKHVVRRQKQQQQVPKGCLAVKVGETESEQKRFVVPVIWFNHPLFMQLLKEAEDEYGFEQKGTITIPCTVQHFYTVVSLIIHQHNHNEHFGCFRAC